MSGSPARSGWPGRRRWPRGVAPAGVWLAHTDADSRVPAQWLLAQLALARLGSAMVVGSVRPARDDLPASSWRSSS